MNVSTPARRRVLRLIAGSAGATLFPTAQANARPAAYEWRGQALGAVSTITLFEPDRQTAERALSLLLDEVARLERCFSLFDPGSEITRLNSEGRLDGASPDFRALLAAALDMAAASDGAFDPTVQPLWRHLAACAQRGRLPSAVDIDRHLASIGYGGVAVDGATVRFTRPGMALTLNGIAQGFISDRSSDLLRDLGYTRVLVQLGETVAWAPPGERRWRVTVPHPQLDSRTIGQFDVANGAVATSSGAALRFDETGSRHHLLDAHTGASPRHWQSVAVQAPRAVVADGLSTALAVAPPARLGSIMRRYPDTKMLALSQNGTVHREGERIMNDAREAPRPVETRWWVLFGGYGLRPFFLFGAIYSVVALGGWLHLLMGVDFWTAPPWISGTVWHGHEMIFGYAGAVIAGFMLTAVPNWTNSAILTPGPLVALFAVWLAGRFALWNVAVLPPPVVAAVDLSFLPLLAVLAGGPVVIRRMYRNLVFVGVLLLLTAANALIHLEALDGNAGTADTGLNLALDSVVLLLVIVGGRIVPAFTTNFLRQKLGTPGLRNPAPLTKATILATVAMIVADAVAPHSAVAGALSLAAGLLVLLRLSGWRGVRCLNESLIWILHIGYLWLGIGLLLKGVTPFDPDIPVTAAVHALGAGAVGAMTLGVMARAGLGHTGRILTASVWLTLVFVLVNLGALIRVIAAWQPEMFGISAYTISGATWSAAFVLFVILFAPILARARIDGRPG